MELDKIIMKLNKKEFKAMNTPFRWWVQRNIEFGIFKRNIEKYNIDLRNTTILDVGCGSGLSTQLIHNEFMPDRLVAFDLMPEQIELSKKRNIPAEFFVGDTTNINLPESTFDAVFVMGILHHIPKWQKALQEIHRILKENGVFLIEEPSNFLLFLADILGFTHPSEAKSFWSEFEKELINIGFKILSKEKILFCLGQSYLCKKNKIV